MQALRRSSKLFKSAFQDANRGYAIVTHPRICKFPIRKLDRTLTLESGEKRPQTRQ